MRRRRFKTRRVSRRVFSRRRRGGRRGRAGALRIGHRM